ncbi:MAG: Fe-S protein assembly co-chaperone HscB [Candidatus Accumulibacter sp.]|jgi:molecular chaperone HscB|nr:Fe-S protein assembly co-chaperone HscB [Accumulibacter sp.]
MDFNVDHFALFGLPKKFRTDPDLLDKRYREMQVLAHPDRYAGAGDAEKRVSMQWATRVNEAYQTLKNPLRRAAYLMLLAGKKLDVESNTAMPTEFLIEQMEWREAVAEARRACANTELEQFYHRVKQQMKCRYERLASLLDDKADTALAEDEVLRLMFLDKLVSEIDDALVALEA